MTFPAVAGRATLMFLFFGFRSGRPGIPVCTENYWWWRPPRTGVDV